jgi:thiamine-phosphate diphosphorylase
VTDGSGLGTGDWELAGAHHPVPSPQSPVPIIHAVTDDLILTRPWFLERARRVMGALGGRGAVHLRARIVPTARLFALAQALVEGGRQTACWVVVNDRVDIALAAEAQGVQLTSRSMRVVDAHAIAPALALGASVHAADEAATAEAEGASWVVAGHVFETKSHPGEPGRGVRFVEALRAATRLPCIAIGGIRPAHVRALRAAGVYGVAAITGIWGAADAERAAADYLSAYDEQSV